MVVSRWYRGSARAGPVPSDKLSKHSADDVRAIVVRRIGTPPCSGWLPSGSPGHSFPHRPCRTARRRALQRDKAVLCISVFLWLLTHKPCPRRFRHHFSCLHIAATVSFGRLKRKATGKRKGGRCPAELASS